jgi:cell division protein FtsB
MKLSPAQSLGLLILMSLSISGWFYGVYWKRVASGSLFTKEETVIIKLQNQIEVLTENNAELTDQVNRLRNPDGMPENAEANEATPISGGVTAPFEKVELPKKSRF